MADAVVTSKPVPLIVRWIIDTRPLWPVPQRPNRKDEVQELKVIASRALALLPVPEQESVLKYYRVQDAKMSLASHLLKHLIITKYCGIPWLRSTISSRDNGKPCYLPEKSPDKGRVDFNVSHQAGIVSLIAAIGFEDPVDVGTDVVCVNERAVPDYASIEKDGFFHWVDMHGDVFAETEINFMKLSPVELNLGTTTAKLHGYGREAISRCQWRNQKVDLSVLEGDELESLTIESNTIVDAKLRRFYAMWCLREAYVKMTGEALLAPWLKQLSFNNVRVPAPEAGLKEGDSLEKGESVTNFRIDFKGKLVANVRMELTALGTNYMVAGAVRTVHEEDAKALVTGRWQELDVEKDILEFAESSS